MAAVPALLASARPTNVAASQGAMVQEGAPMPAIRLRSEWGGDLQPTKPIETETPKYLLIHHTSEPGSDYEEGEVAGILRSIFGFHTGSDKAWADVAYNFFVDKYGGIWEGRTGSVVGPVRGSATGGNQGYSQLCCFLGDFELEPPPQAAVNSMLSLLSWLAGRYKIDMTPGATATFVSLGSNKHPKGKEVTTETISTHRQMSETTCPGTACHNLVTSQFQQQTFALLGSPAPAATQPVPTSAPVAPTEPLPAVTPTTEPAPTTTSAPQDQTTTSTTTVVSGPDREEEMAQGVVTVESGGPQPWQAALGATAAASVAATVIGVRSKSRHRARMEVLAPAATDGFDVPYADRPASAYAGSPLVAGEIARNVVREAGDGSLRWWPAVGASGADGQTSGETRSVFWLVGSNWSEADRSFVQSTVGQSVSPTPESMSLATGQWFTQLLNDILGRVSPPPGDGLVIGVSDGSECMAVSVGDGRVGVPGVKGLHQAEPDLPLADTSDAWIHRWDVESSPAWIVSWLGGTTTVPVDPQVVVARSELRQTQFLDEMSGTRGYLAVRPHRNGQ
ncbi:MAG: N-acetylmuramoyl-L-alanine amidase [Candidatus Microthrix parvicella]